MKRAAALLLCLASAWMLLGLAAELFLVWYNGVEDQLDAMAWARFTTQAIVDLAALVLFGRLAWHRPSPRPNA